MHAVRDHRVRCKQRRADRIVAALARRIVGVDPGHYRGAPRPSRGRDNRNLARAERGHRESHRYL